MTVYCDVVNVSTGTAVNTFGASATVTLNSKAKRVIGIVSSGADATFTAEEGAASVLRIASDDLGFGNQDFPIPPYTTSGPATNGSGQGAKQNILPLDWEAKGNERVVVDVGLTGTITVARLHAVGVIYTDEMPLPNDWKMRFPGIVNVKGGASVNASQLTTTETALTAITVPGWAKEIIAAKAAVLKTGAITAAEEVLAVFRLNSTIPDLGIQEFPSNGIGATLGTPVGTGISFDDIPWIPMYVPMRGKNETVTPQVNLRTAVTTANRVVFGLAWR